MQRGNLGTLVLTAPKDIEVIRQSRLLEDLLDNALDAYASLEKETVQAHRETKQAQRAANFWQAAFFILLSVCAGWGIVGGFCVWALHWWPFQ